MGVGSEGGGGVRKVLSFPPEEGFRFSLLMTRCGGEVQPWEFLSKNGGEKRGETRGRSWKNFEKTHLFEWGAFKVEGGKG